MELLISVTPSTYDAAPTIAQGIVGGLKNIIGGRIGAYTEMCEQARQQAYDSMVKHAQDLGANAIVGVVRRFRSR
jgi:uncharacterized protein YbjQ (UPF0145 family)